MLMMDLGKVLLWYFIFCDFFLNSQLPKTDTIIGYPKPNG